MPRFRYVMLVLTAVVLLTGASTEGSAIDCAAVPEDTERLACYDATAGRDAQISALEEEFGNPDGRKDAQLLQNAERTDVLLPGTWLASNWDVVFGLSRDGKITDACEHIGVEISRSENERWTYVGLQPERDGKRLVAFRLRWAGGNNFHRITDLDDQLENLGIDPERQGAGTLLPMLQNSVTPMVLTPRGSDILVGLSPTQLHPWVLVRCP